MLRSTALLMLASSLAFAAPVPKAKVKDAEAIQGRWQIVEMSGEGVPKSHGDPVLSAVFEQGKIDVSCGGAEIALLTLHYILDPEKTHLDVRRTADVDGDDIGKGIYRLDGDSLTIALTQDGEARPKEAKAGAGIYFFKLQRLAKEKQ